MVGFYCHCLVLLRAGLDSISGSEVRVCGANLDDLGDEGRRSRRTVSTQVERATWPIRRNDNAKLNQEVRALGFQGETSDIRSAVHS